LTAARSIAWPNDAASGWTLSNRRSHHDAPITGVQITKVQGSG
jgi:hypothetical protein